MAIAAEVATEAVIAEHRQGFRRRWYRTPSFVGGVSILGTIVLLAMLAPLISRHDPTSQDLLHTLQGPTSSHWLGTDELGRPQQVDVLGDLGGIASGRRGHAERHLEH